MHKYIPCEAFSGSHWKSKFSTVMSSRHGFYGANESLLSQEINNSSLIPANESCASQKINNSSLHY